MNKILKVACTLLLLFCVPAYAGPILVVVFTDVTGQDRVATVFQSTTVTTLLNGPLHPGDTRNIRFFGISNSSASALYLKTISGPGTTPNISVAIARSVGDSLWVSNADSVAVYDARFR